MLIVFYWLPLVDVLRNFDDDAQIKFSRFSAFAFKHLTGVKD